MAEPVGDDRLAGWEALWGLVARIIFSFLGATLVTYEVVLAQGDDTTYRIIGTLAGIAMMGPVVAASLSSLIAALRGSQE